MIPNIDKVIDLIHKKDLNDIIDALNKVIEKVETLPDEIKGDINIVIDGKTQIMEGATEEADGKEGLVPVPPAGSNIRFLSSDGTFKEAPIPENVSDFNNDAEYITIEDVPKKLSDLENDLGYINSGSVLNEYSGNINDLVNMGNGWYKWYGTLSETTCSWIICKMGSLYIANSEDDPRIVLNSNDLTVWYSPYGYWHA